MKTKTITLTFAGILLANLLAAQIIDTWSFTYADDTGLADALSNNGTSLGNNSALVSVQNNALQFGSTNTDGSTTTLSTFRTADLSIDPITSGILEVSWDVVSLDFTISDAVDGAGRQGWFFRYQGTSNVDVGARLTFNGNDLVLEYTDADNSNTAAHTWAGVNSVSDLFIRYTVDLDSLGSASSFNLYYTESGGSEQLAFSGVVPAVFQVDQFRTVQQVTNGGTDWRVGDTIVVDNLTVAAVPEPGAIAMLFGMITLGFVLFRRIRK